MTQPTRKGRTLRLLGASSVAAMAFGVLPISPVSAALADICPAPGQTDRFTDDTGTTHEANINCAAAYGLVTGTTPTTYNPTGNLTRGQAATMLVNYVERSSGTVLVADATPDFTDTAGSVHAANIEKAADNDILSGFNDRTFRPTLPITRAQFASIAVRATERVLGRALVANSTNEFDDDNGSVHEANIEKAVDNGILVGTGVRMFSPQANIQRGQAASILVGAAGNVLQPAGRFAARPAVQTFAVTPQESATLTVVNEASGAANVATDDRTYTVSGLTAGTTYRISLVDSASIQTAANGAVTFRSSADAASSTGFSVDVGADNANIIRVNNANPTFADGDTEARSTTVMPVAGSITFTIDGTGPGSVTPVVYVNGGAGGTALTGGTSTRLETSATAATVAAGTFSSAIESFGLGGPTVYVAPLGANGLINTTGATGGAATTVLSVDKTADSLNASVGGSVVRFTFDANDLFTVGGVSVGLAGFEAQLSSGDTISGTFTTDPAGVSQFNLTDSNPATPALTVTSVTTGVQVAYTVEGDFDSVNIYRALSANNTDCTTTLAASYALVGNDTISPFVDTTVTRPEQYCYTASAVNDGDESVRSGASFISITAADAAAPTIVEVRAGEGAGAGNLVGVADSGDTIRFVFSEAVAAGTNTGTFRVQDADGTIADITCGAASVTCTLRGAGTFNGTARAANTVLDVALGATPGILTAGSNPGLQYPLTITNVSAAFDDVAGNQLDLAGSADRAVETGALTGTETASEAPTFAGATAVNGTRNVVVTYSEALNCSTVATGDYTITSTVANSTAITPSTATCSGGTVTLTFAGGDPFVTGASYRLDVVNGQVVSDQAGTNQVDTDFRSFTVTAS